MPNDRFASPLLCLVTAEVCSAVAVVWVVSVLFYVVVEWQAVKNARLATI